MKYTSLFGLIVICFHIFYAKEVKARDNKWIEDQMTVRENNFRTHYDTRINKGSEKEREKLSSKYIAALHREIKKATDRGALNYVLLFQKELSRVANNEELTELPDSSPREFLRLRNFYQNSLKDIEEARREKAFYMYKAWDDSLESFQKQLTRDRKIHAAVFVQEFREEKIGSLLIELKPLDHNQESSPRDKLPISEKFTNSIEMEFVQVPLTGARNRRKKVFFSTKETRVMDFRLFVEATGHDGSIDENGVRTGKTWDNPGYRQGDTHPVTMVSWQDAKKFCDWLTEKERREGLIDSKVEYRLPTDHEWSCAIGIGEQERDSHEPRIKHKAVPGYHWGNQWPPPEAIGNFHSKNSHSNSLLPIDNYDRTSPSGTFEVSKTGLYDLAGNLWEWTEDRWAESNEKSRVVRGGCWQTYESNQLFRSSRKSFGLADRKDIVGFRIVLGD